MTYSSCKRTGFSVEFTSNNKHFKICTTFNPVLDTGRFDIKSFRFMLIQSRCTWLKEREIFTFFFLLTRKLYLKWSKSLCSFTAWVRIETGLYQNDRFPSSLHSFFKRIFWTYLFFYLLESLLQRACFIFCLTVLRLRRGLSTLDLRGFLFMFGQFKAQCTPVHFCWVKPLSKAQDVTLKCAYCPLCQKNMYITNVWVTNSSNVFN